MSYNQAGKTTSGRSIEQWVTITSIGPKEEKPFGRYSSHPLVLSFALEEGRGADLHHREFGVGEVNHVGCFEIDTNLIAYT